MMAANGAPGVRGAGGGDAQAAAMRRHGVPEAILSDNGDVFAARFGNTCGCASFSGG